MKRKYEKKGPPDKAELRNLLAKDGRDYLLPLVNVFALAGGALDQPALFTSGLEARRREAASALDSKC